MDNQTIKVPTWYWVVAIIFLLWNLMGIGSFFAHAFISEETLSAMPVAEQELIKGYPIWTYIVFAIAVFGGTIGSIGLIMRKKWAKMAFIISLVGIIPQMTYGIFFTDTIEVYGAAAMVMPVMIVVVGIFLVWYAGSISKRGWLK